MALTKVTYPMIDGVETITTPDIETVSFVGRTTDYTGGTPGFVGNAIKAVSNAGAGVANYEWAITGVVNNSATGGENVGVYGQGNKLSTGPTWGMVAEAQDKTGTANPTTGLVGLEVDCRANGSDVNRNRIGILAIAGKYNSELSDCTVGYGLVFASADNTSSAKFDRAIAIKSDCNVGLDCTQSTISSAAIALDENQPIAFDSGLTQKLTYDTVGLAYTNTTTGAFVRLNKDGTYQSKLFTVNTLPASANPGSRAFVSDATSNVFNAAAVGGGSYGMPVFYDGFSWKIG